MSLTLDLKRFWAMNAQRLNKIAKSSVIDLSSEMQNKTPGVTIGGALIPGRMPYVSEDLVNSFTISVGGSTAVGEFAYMGAMSGYVNGDEVSVYWDSEYANYIENGDENFPGWHFMGNNLYKWQEIVHANARKHRNRYR